MLRQHLPLVIFTSLFRQRADVSRHDARQRTRPECPPRTSHLYVCVRPPFLGFFEDYAFILIAFYFMDADAAFMVAHNGSLAGAETRVSKSAQASEFSRGFMLFWPSRFFSAMRGRDKHDGDARCRRNFAAVSSRFLSQPPYECRMAFFFVIARQGDIYIKARYSNGLPSLLSIGDMAASCGRLNTTRRLLPTTCRAFSILAIIS